MGKDSKKKLIRDHHKSSNKSPKKKLSKPIETEKHEKKGKKESKSVESKPDKKSSKKIKIDVPDHEDEEVLQEVQKKPGQKHSEPSLDDSTRAFYESLYEQNPDSLMAQKYCLEYGLLSEEVALSLLGKLKHKNK
jgi:hypothetical protein